MSIDGNAVDLETAAILRAVENDPRFFMNMIQEGQKRFAEQHGPMATEEVAVGAILAHQRAPELMTASAQTEIISRARELYSAKFKDKPSPTADLSQYNPGELDVAVFGGLQELLALADDTAKRSAILTLENNCCKSSECPKMRYQKLLLRAVRERFAVDK